MCAKCARHHLMKRRKKTNKPGLDVMETVAAGTIIGVLASSGCPVNGPDFSA